VHPAVHKDLQQWIEKQQRKGHTAAIEEAALTFEAGHENYFDAIITVVAPQPMLIRRVMKRDRISRKQVIERLSRQWPQEFKCRHSKGIILNDGQHSLIFQVQNIIDRWSL
jgi:dephospho-CoA kinase